MFIEPEISARLFLAGLVAGEIYLLVVRSQPAWMRIAYFAFLLAIWIAADYLVVEPTAGQVAYPLRFAISMVLTFSVTIAIFAAGLELAVKLKPRYMPHVALVIFMLALAFFWPTFAVTIHCGLVECF